MIAFGAIARAAADGRLIAAGGIGVPAANGIIIARRAIARTAAADERAAGSVNLEPCRYDDPVGIQGRAVRIVGIDAHTSASANQKLIVGGRNKVGALRVGPHERALMIGFGVISGRERIIGGLARVPGGDAILIAATAPGHKEKAASH